MKLLKYSAILLALSLNACGDDDDNNNDCASLYSYCYATTGDDITVSGTTVSGTGSISFGQIADTAETGKNFLMTITLDDGQSATLNAFTDAGLANGVDVVLTRSGTQVTYAIGDHSGVLMTADLAEADGSAAMTVNVDIHNDEAPEPHVIIWEGSSTPTDENAESLETHAETAGQGAFAGVTLAGGTLTNFVVSDVKIEHE